MKPMLVALCILVVLASGCGRAAIPPAAIPPTAIPPAATPVPTASPAPQPTDTPVAAAATPSPLPATATPEATPTTPPPAISGAPASFDVLNLTVPQDLASGVSGSIVAPSTDGGGPPWEMTPGHTLLKLQGYLLQERFHQPQIFVYPAAAYGEMSTIASESIQRLQAIISDPGAPLDAEQLPKVPFFNAAQVFAANIQPLSFQNGQGVRFLSEYAQYAAPANNQDLFYHFQGLTDDGAYYVIVILPVTAPLLAETSDPGAVVPQGGIAYPDMADPKADWQGYTDAVSALLEDTPPQAFVPSLDQLDLLVQSLEIAP